MTSSMSLLAQRADEKTATDENLFDKMKDRLATQKPKQESIPSFMEEIATGKLFKAAEPYLHLLRYAEAENDAVQAQIMSLYEEMRSQVYRGAQHYGIYDTEVEATLPYRFVLRLSNMSPEEILYVLTGSTDDEFMGKNSKFWKTREGFKKQIIHDASRSEARRKGKNVSLSQLTREADDTRSGEDIASSMKNLPGSRWNPRPVGVERPPGKWEADLRDIVEGSNERIGGIPYGLGNIYFRSVYLAAAPNYRANIIHELGKKAGSLYLNDIKLLLGADAAIYPTGGPLKQPPDVITGNKDGNFNVYWVTDGKTMHPYLGDMGRKKTKSLFNEMISMRMNRELIGALARSYCGRIDTTEMEGIPDDLQELLLKTQNHATHMVDHTIVFRHMPETIREHVIKQLRMALSEPKGFLKRIKVSPPQAFTQAAEIVSLPRRRRESLVKAMRTLAVAEGMTKIEAENVDLEESLEGDNE